jgi:hypothetical protein
MPLAWMAPSASPSAAASTRTAGSGSGPPSSTSSRRFGPSTNSVAIHGCSPSGSASTTRAVYVPVPPTVCAARTSCRNRARKVRSWAYSDRTTFTASRSPARDSAR